MSILKLLKRKILTKLETTTKNGDKVMAYTITKELSVPIEELIVYAKSININVKSAQHILSLKDANTLVGYILNEKAKLHFDSDEWKSNSNINDYQNLIKFIDNTLSIIDTQITRNSDILENSNDAYKQLQLLDINNSSLIEIKIYLLSKFDFSLEHLKDKLIFMKSECLDYLDTIDNSSSIWIDEELSHKKIDFNFTASKIVRLYEEQLRKIDNFSNVDKFFSELLSSLEALQKSDEKFHTTDRKKLETILKNGYLEEYQHQLFKEWKDEIEKVDKFYIKFIKAYFTGKISANMLLEIFAIFQIIKEDLEDFYLTIRSGLVTKYKENPKSQLIQEIATKDRIYKIYQNSQPRFIELLKKETSQVAYRFLNHILSELLDFKIEEKSEGYEEIYEKMVKLHTTNLEIYLNDIVTYGKELEKRDMEISKLMFKMTTDLEKVGE